MMKKKIAPWTKATATLRFKTILGEFMREFSREHGIGITPGKQVEFSNRLYALLDDNAQLFNASRILK